MNLITLRSCRPSGSVFRPRNRTRFVRAILHVAHAAILLICLAALFSTTAFGVTMSWSPVGNPGNAPDSTGLGAVNYSYNIGTYDVSVGQYVEFLNAKDPTGSNTLGLYTEATGVITYSPGAAVGSKYSVPVGTANHPVSYVNWFDAARFANWLGNGQGNADTETGGYTLLGGTPIPSNAETITRNPGAKIFLPSADEWYKAAYYNPTTASYYQYPTSSNTAPTAEGPPGGANSANYLEVVGELTDVGAYSGTTSPYGAFDMGGDVWQWTEAPSSTFFGFSRDLRGGAYLSTQSSDLLSSSYPYPATPDDSHYDFGFRLASVPEPSSLALAVSAVCLLSFAAARGYSS